jgi:hypothetical protein
MRELPSNSPHPIGTEVFFNGSSSIIVAKVIDAERLKHDLEVPSTDESIPLSVIPAGTAFNTVKVLRASPPIQAGFSQGTIHKLASSMLFPINKGEDIPTP